MSTETRWFEKGEKNRFISHKKSGEILIPVEGIRIEKEGLYEFELLSSQRRWTPVRVVAGPLATKMQIVEHLSPTDMKADIVIRNYALAKGMSSSANRDGHLLAWRDQASYDAWYQEFIVTPEVAAATIKADLHAEVVAAAAKFTAANPQIEVGYSDTYGTWKAIGDGVWKVNMTEKEAMNFFST